MAVRPKHAPKKTHSMWKQLSSLSFKAGNKYAIGTLGLRDVAHAVGSQRLHIVPRVGI